MSLVSVIIPTKNRAERLIEAIHSVDRQTYPDIEIIVVDGGSTDHTAEAIEKVESQISQPITYLRNERPLGPSVARNQGVEAANGEYIAFLDDDDRWTPNKTAIQMQKLHRSPPEVAVVYCGYAVVNDDGSVSQKVTPTSDGDVFEDQLVSYSVGPLQTMIIRRDAFERIGGLDDSFALAEDWDFTIRFARQYEFAVVPKPLVAYVRHDDQITQNIEKLKESCERILFRYEGELERNGVKHVAWAHHHRYIGNKHCEQGELGRGREELRKSLALQPDGYTAFIYCLTFLGNRGFGSIVRLKRSFETRTLTAPRGAMFKSQ